MGKRWRPGWWPRDSMEWMIVSWGAAVVFGCLAFILWLLSEGELGG